MKGHLPAQRGCEDYLLNSTAMVYRHMFANECYSKELILSDFI